MPETQRRPGWDMDRRRNNGPEASVRPVWPPGTDATLLEPAPSADGAPHEIMRGDGTRLDGRYPEETRPLTLRPGAVPRAAGSVYAEQGASSLVVSVYGPRAGVGASRSPTGRAAWAVAGQLSCAVDWAPWATPGRRGPHAPDAAEYDAAEAVLQALAPAVRTEAIAGAYVDIFVVVLGRDGLDTALAITAASAALILAGVEMRDSVVGVSLAVLSGAFGSAVVVDPTALEARVRESPLVAPFSASGVVAAVLPNRGGLLSQLFVSGPVPSLDDVSAYAIDAARAIYDEAVRPVISS